jgi:hypothetical protein
MITAAAVMIACRERDSDVPLPKDAAGGCAVVSDMATTASTGASTAAALTSSTTSLLVSSVDTKGFGSSDAEAEVAAAVVVIPASDVPHFLQKRVPGVTGEEQEGQ